MKTVVISESTLLLIQFLLADLEFVEVMSSYPDGPVSYMSCWENKTHAVCIKQRAVGRYELWTLVRK